MSKNKKVRSGPRPPRGVPGLGGSMGGGGMGGLLAQMQKLQEDMEKTQAELADVEVTASVGGGMVTVVATGDRNIRSITIKPEVVNPEDVEMLQDLVLSAVNEAIEKAGALQEERMGGLTGGLNLPPGLGF